MITRVAQVLLLALLLSSCATPKDRSPVTDAEKPQGIRLFQRSLR